MVTAPAPGKVAIASCCLDSVTAEFTLDLMSLQNHHEVVSAPVIARGTLLPMARNYAINEVYKHTPDFSHLLFVDADTADFNINHVLCLLSNNVDIVSGIVTQRTPPYKIAGEPMNPNHMNDEFAKPVRERKAIEAKSVGMAFTLITREVLDTLREETSEGPLWFVLDRMQRGSILKEAEEAVDTILGKDYKTTTDMREDLLGLVQLGINAHFNTPIIGEDVNFSWRARTVGFKVYFDPRVVVGHKGTRVFDIRDTVNARMKEMKKDQIEENQKNGKPTKDKVYHVTKQRGPVQPSSDKINPKVNNSHKGK